MKENGLAYDSCSLVAFMEAKLSSTILCFELIFSMLTQPNTVIGKCIFLNKQQQLCMLETRQPDACVHCVSLELLIQ